MKRILLTLAALILVVFYSEAQRYKGGFRTGVNVAALTAPLGQETDQIDIGVGFHIGGYGRMSVSNSFRVQLELLYSQRGGKFVNLDNDGDGRDLIPPSGTPLRIDNLQLYDKLNYIDIPILASFHGRGSSFLLGLQPSFLVGVNQSFSGDEAQKQTFLDEYYGGDVKNFHDYQSFDLAALIGFELELDMGLNFGLRFSYGLMNALKQDAVNKTKTDYPTEFPQFFPFSNFHNVTGQFSVGYTIGGAR